MFTLFLSPPQHISLSLSLSLSLSNLVLSSPLSQPCQSHHVTTTPHQSHHIDHQATPSSLLCHPPHHSANLVSCEILFFSFIFQWWVFFFFLVVVSFFLIFFFLACGNCLFLAKMQNWPYNFLQISYQSFNFTFVHFSPLNFRFIQLRHFR